MSEKIYDYLTYCFDYVRWLLAVDRFVRVFLIAGQRNHCA